MPSRNALRLVRPFPVVILALVLFPVLSIRISAQPYTCGAPNFLTEQHDNFLFSNGFESITIETIPQKPNSMPVLIDAHFSFPPGDWSLRVGNASSGLTIEESGSGYQSLRNYLNELCGGSLRTGTTGSVHRGAAPAGLSIYPPVSGQASQSIVQANFLSGSTGTAWAGDSSVTISPGGNAPTVSYPIPSGGQALIAADFNADGKPDIAVISFPNSGNGSLSVLLNNGDGTFQPAKTVATNGGPLSLAAADFNGDGKLDVAVSNSTNNSHDTISFFAGKGDGTFAAPIDFPVGSGPVSLVAADFNNDNRPDIAVADRASADLAVLLSNTSGPFQPARIVKTGITRPSLSYLDLNHDGNLDLLVADQGTSSIFVLSGNGDGTFQSPAAYASAEQPGAAAVIPLEDNSTVIATMDYASGLPTFQFADPSGNMSTPPILFYSGNAFGIAAAPFSSTVADIAVASSNGVVVQTLNSGFPAASPQTLSTGIAGAVAFGNFNGDNDTDLLIASGGPSGGLTLYPGESDGSTFRPPVTSPGPPLAGSIAIADFNSDGRLDAVIGGASGLTLSIGNGDGTFQAPVSIPLAGTAGLSPSSVLAAKFTAAPSLVVTLNNPLFEPGRLVVLNNDGRGNFSSGPVIPSSAISGPIGGIAVGDFNGDGLLDLAVASSQFSGAANSQIAILLGAHGGTFTQGPITRVNGIPTSLAAADFNGDGFADLLLGDSGTNGASYLISRGDGSFQAQTPMQAGGSTQFAAAADLNADGKPDAAFAGSAQFGYVNSFASSYLFSQFPKTLSAAASSAANGNIKTLAPGSLGTIYGSSLATSIASASTLPLPTALGGSSVTVTDSTGASYSASLIYTNPVQINFVVPSSLAAGPATISVSANGTLSEASTEIAAVAPGLFTIDAAGLAAADVLTVSSSGAQTPSNDYALSAGQVVPNPISLGSSSDQVYLILFGTGLRAAGTKGVSVTAGGASATVTYAGPQGAFVGLDQVNVLLPRSLAGKGDIAIQATASGVSSNPVHVTVQ